MPKKGQTADVNAREAAAWYVRLHDATATDADCDAFLEWVQADPSHSRAYTEITQLWTRLRQPAEELGADGWYRQLPAEPGPLLPHAFRAVTAGVVLLLIITGVWWRDPGLITRTVADFATRPGGQRQVTLADGTHAYLDGDSAMNLAIDHLTREVQLLRGRVWFEVAHKQQSGFSVIAGGVETRVLGTAFAVEYTAAAVSVTVERGQVTVTTGQHSVAVSAGQRLRVAAGFHGSPEAADLDIALAWRRGVLVFDRASLAQVIAELDRMSTGRVLLADDTLRHLTLSGVFRTDDPAAVLGALRAGLGVQTTTIPGLATFVHR
ncbi:MAG: FecR domain-containing protein [Thermodesulfobacteriota bacterium]|jgi:transmembrane sensor